MKPLPMRQFDSFQDLPSINIFYLREKNKIVSLIKKLKHGGDRVRLSYHWESQTQLAYVWLDR